MSRLDKGDKGVILCFFQIYTHKGCLVLNIIPTYNQWIEWLQIGITLIMEFFGKELLIQKSDDFIGKIKTLTAK
jgi:hypothetical protein